MNHMILIFSVAPLVVIPLGFILIRRVYPKEASILSFNFLAGIFPIAIMLLFLSLYYYPTGKTTGYLTLPWGFVTLIAALQGISLLMKAGYKDISKGAVAAGLLMLPLGAWGLFLSRQGITTLGFSEPFIFLFAIHFHYASFAALLLTGVSGKILMSESNTLRILFKGIAFCVIFGVPLVAVGFIYSDPLKFVSILLLSFGLTLLGILQIFLLKKISALFTKSCLLLSSVSILAGMILALVYSHGEYSGQFHISIPGMVPTHGILNALGFSLFGLIGWVLATKPDPAEKPVVVYDGECGICAGNLKWLHRLDWLHVFDDAPYQAEELYKKFPQLKREECEKAMHLVFPKGETYLGADAIRHVWLRMPATFFLGWLVSIPPLPWILRKLYPHIAKNRYHLGGQCKLSTGEKKK